MSNNSKSASSKWRFSYMQSCIHVGSYLRHQVAAISELTRVFDRIFKRVSLRRPTRLIKQGSILYMVKTLHENFCSKKRHLWSIEFSPLIPVFYKIFTRPKYLYHKIYIRIQTADFYVNSYFWEYNWKSRISAGKIVRYTKRCAKYCILDISYIFPPILRNFVLKNFVKCVKCVKKTTISISNLFLRIPTALMYESLQTTIFL